MSAALAGTDGWASISFDPAGIETDPNPVTNGRILAGTDDGDNVVALRGLPVMGFAAQAYTNGNVSGNVANYAAAFEHKTETFVSDSSTQN